MALNPLFCNPDDYLPAHTDRENKTQRRESRKPSIKINERYVSTALRDALKYHDYVSLRSDVGTGKTFALADIIDGQGKDDLSIVVTHLQSLLLGNVTRIDHELKLTGRTLHLAHYQYAKLADIKEAACVFTTLNSLPKILDMAINAGRTINLLFLDESEACAQFLTGDAIDNVSEVGRAFQYLSRHAKKIVLADAHLSANSRSLGYRFFNQCKFTLLDNQYPVWAEKKYTYEWSGSSVDEGIGLIKGLLAQGKKLFVAFTSKAEAEKVYGRLHKLGLLDELKVLRAFETLDRANEELLQYCKNDHSQFNQFDLVLASPSVGVGISIDTPEGTRPHFDAVVAFLTRHKHAPDSKTAVQMLFRARDLVDKHIYLVKLDQIEYGYPIGTIEAMRDKKILNDQYDLLIRHHIDDEVVAEFLRLESAKYTHFESSIRIERYNDFTQYYERIDQLLQAKGIKRLDASPVNAANTSNIAKIIRMETKEAHLNAIANAPTINDTELTEMELKRKHTDLSVEEVAMLERHYLTRAYHFFEPDEPTKQQLEHYIELQARGIAQGRNRIANAFLTLKEVNQLQRYFVTNAKHKMDITDKRLLALKADWQLDRILVDAIGLQFNEVANHYEFADKKLVLDAESIASKAGGRSITQRIGECLDEFNATNPDNRISRHMLKNENPLKTVIKLLDTRLKIKTRKTKGADAYTLAHDQLALDNLNQVIRLRPVGLSKVLRSLAVDDILDNGMLNSTTCKQLGIDSEVRQFLANALQRIPQHKHKKALAQYLFLCEQPRIAGSQFSPVATANQYLHTLI